MSFGCWAVAHSRGASCRPGRKGSAVQVPQTWMLPTPLRKDGPEPQSLHSGFCSLTLCLGQSSLRRAWGTGHGRTVATVRSSGWGSVLSNRLGQLRPPRVRGSRSPFYRGGNRGPEMLSDFLSWSWIRTQAAWLQSSSLDHKPPCRESQAGGWPLQQPSRGQGPRRKAALWGKVSGWVDAGCLPRAGPWLWWRRCQRRPPGRAGLQMCAGSSRPPRPGLHRGALSKAAATSREAAWPRATTAPTARLPGQRRQPGPTSPSVRGTLRRTAAGPLSRLSGGSGLLLFVFSVAPAVLQS
jgi:hypothetical protein